MKKLVILFLTSFLLNSLTSFAGPKVLDVIAKLKSQPNLDLIQIDEALNDFKRDSVSMKTLSEITDFPIVRVFGLNAL